MSDEPNKTVPDGKTEFSRQIALQEARKLRAQQKAARSVWFGFGMSGIIGWSIAVPAVLAALLGIWLDKHYPGGHSWTLALLAAGLVYGCWNAWRWVDNQDQAIKKDLD